MSEGVAVDHRNGRRAGSGLPKRANVIVPGGVRAVLPLAAARDGVWAAATGSCLGPARPSAGQPRALEDGAGQCASAVSPRWRPSRAKGGTSAREFQSSRYRRVTPSTTNGEAEAGADQKRNLNNEGGRAKAAVTRNDAFWDKETKTVRLKPGAIIWRFISRLRERSAGVVWLEFIPLSLGPPAPDLTRGEMGAFRSFAEKNLSWRTQEAKLRRAGSAPVTLMV
jgi:hypothetical protein